MQMEAKNPEINYKPFFATPWCVLRLCLCEHSDIFCLLFVLYKSLMHKAYQIPHSPPPPPFFLSLTPPSFSVPACCPLPSCSLPFGECS